MEWIKTEREEMRGKIEPRSQFVNRNIEWWWINRKFERVRRRKYYEKFLAFGKIETNDKQIVGEVGPGPFGGMIEVMKLSANRKVFIDYILEDLYNLHFIKWPDNSTMVEAPAEHIPLRDDFIDVLLSYNTLDHGWDIETCIKECIRVSKKCYLAFDCRGDDNGEVDIRKDGHDLDHYQLVHLLDIIGFMQEEMPFDVDWHVEDMKIKHFPVAFIKAEKLELC